MKKSSMLFMGLIFFSLLTSGASFGNDTILIKNGTIVAVDGKAPTKASLLIENGLIIKIAKEISVPAGAEIIDATGMFVYPGLISVMTSVGVTGYPGAGDDTNEVGTSTPHIDPYDAVNPEDDVIEVTRIEGITTVQTVSGTRSVINGKSIVLNLAGSLAEEMIFQRDTAQIINLSAKTPGKYPSTLPGVVSYLREQFDRALEYHKKNSEKNSEESRSSGSKEKDSGRDLKMEALADVVSGKTPVIFIAEEEVSLRNTIELIKHYKLKAIIRPGSGVLKYADTLAREKIPVLWASTTTIPQRWEPYDLYYRTASILAEKGVVFAFDPGGRGPGGRNVRNLPVPAAISVAHGLSEEEALRAMTINPAKILGLADRIGSLEEGKVANIAVWSGSPVQLTSRVHHVIINGKIIPMTSLQTRLRDRFQETVRARMKNRKGPDSIS